MVMILNSLETTEEMKQYQKYLTSKPTAKLIRFVRNIERDKQRKKQQYVNHSLRIELIQKELANREKLSPIHID